MSGHVMNKSVRSGPNDEFDGENSFEIADWWGAGGAVIRMIEQRGRTFDDGQRDTRGCVSAN